MSIYFKIYRAPGCPCTWAFWGRWQVTPRGFFTRVLLRKFWVWRCGPRCRRCRWWSWWWCTGRFAAGRSAAIPGAPRGLVAAKRRPGPRWRAKSFVSPPDRADLQISHSESAWGIGKIRNNCFIFVLVLCWKILKWSCISLKWIWEQQKPKTAATLLVLQLYR